MSVSCNSEILIKKILFSINITLPYLFILLTANEGRVKASVFTNLLEAMEIMLDEKDLQRIVNTFSEKDPAGGDKKTIRYQDAIKKLQYRDDVVLVSDSVSQMQNTEVGHWTIRSTLPDLVKSHSQYDIMSRASMASRQTLSK